jgi:hypothetical protein
MLHAAVAGDGLFKRWHCRALGQEIRPQYIHYGIDIRLINVLTTVGNHGL